MSEEPFINDEPTLSEYDGLRYLHFGSEWVQGVMRPSRPSELVLAYTRQMMSWLLFKQPARKDTLGILGLGAGSLTRYSMRYTTSRLVTVEWNPAVTAICRQYFRLPVSERSTVEHIDAGQWVLSPKNHDTLSALMVDLYDADAQGPVRNSLEFYTGCRTVLADDGIMTVNLFGNHDSFQPNIDRIRAAFDDQVLELPEIDAGNRIVLAFKSGIPPVTTADLLSRAQELEQDYRLPEATRWVRELLEFMQQTKKADAEPFQGISRAPKMVQTR